MFCTTYEINVGSIEAAKGANEATRNPPSCFFYFMFCLSVTPSINTPKSCNDFMIFII